MRVLFVGGTGIISSACARLALSRGMEVTFLHRGVTARHPVPPGAKSVHGNVRDVARTRALIGELQFDVVVQWIAFVPEHVEADLELFRGRTKQYVFISSASAYQTPPARLPVTESTPLYNPFWQYSRDKIACEERLLQAYRTLGFPVTIVRPSHTYDAALLPVHGGYTVLDRMRRGLPVIVHGDGTSLWTLTHNEDFARGFVGLLGHPAAIGDSFHITSDESVTWNQIHEYLAREVSVEPRLVHIPSDFIARIDPDWGASLLGDKAHSMVFDNTKMKRLVPEFAATTSYSRGAAMQVAHYEANPPLKVVDSNANEMVERILAAYGRALS